MTPGYYIPRVIPPFPLASHKRNHMDNKIDDGFRIHGGEENDGDSM
jgi:hypothetical protein